MINRFLTLKFIIIIIIIIIIMGLIGTILTIIFFVIFGSAVLGHFLPTSNSSCANLCRDKHSKLGTILSKLFWQGVCSTWCFIFG